MHKLSNLAGGVRHGWDISFNNNRSHDIPRNQPYQQRPSLSTNPPAHLPLATPITWCFNVPLNHTLPGPDLDHIVYSSKGAADKWTLPKGTTNDDSTPRLLPVHEQNLQNLQNLCGRMKKELQVDAVLKCGRASTLAPLPGLQSTQTNNLVASVCVHASQYESVRRAREIVLNSSPITLQSSTVPVDRSIIINEDDSQLNSTVIQWLDEIHNRTQADIFVLDTEERGEDGSHNTDSKEQLKIVIYGDMLTRENAKVHILVMIDRILLNFRADTMALDHSMHSLLWGRSKKKIKAIESATDTAIYLPPIFPRVHTYAPEGAERRDINEIVITGRDQEHIQKAKMQLQELTMGVKTFMKDARITGSKLDHLLLERLDKIQSIMESHASYLLLPSLGQQVSGLRVQGIDVLNVERTIRDLMGLTTQFYSAEWQCTGLRGSPPLDQMFAVLPEICANSGADIIFSNLTFYALGSDEACRTALNVISQISWLKNVQSAIRIKLELANEHKEFVSGKKNGKINKIMNTANVQIVFDGFNEYNFYIDVRGNDYAQIMHGLELVEAELPASLSFHVPDQYHKRIIGIGGQHIQQLMKKYSVFVKFSNAHDRGPVIGKEDEALKLDNVICRTPSRNAQNLELVKQEIMDMVNRPDAEQVTEHVTINRLLHRKLLSAHMQNIEMLEKQWNCKISFPSTEQASDVVSVSGPEFQVPNAIYGLLAMVPETHEFSFPASPEIKEFLESPEFQSEVVDKLNHQYGIECKKKEGSPNPENPDLQTFILDYTRNNAGALKDALDHFIAQLVVKGLDTSTIKGNIPRPKSDSFEQSLPFFESKLLHRKDVTAGTDSPTRSAFGEASESSEPSAGFFSKFRRPGMSSFTSLIDRRKNGTNSPGSTFFKHASSNASKASLASLESTGSGYRNWWNDSGINLPEEDNLSPPNLNGQGPSTWSLPHPINPIIALSPSHPFASGPSSATTPVSSHPLFGFGNSALPGLHNGNATNNNNGPSPGDMTPTSRYDPRASVDSGRPSTSHSLSGLSGYPGPLNGHHR